MPDWYKLFALLVTVSACTEPQRSPACFFSDVVPVAKLEGFRALNFFFDVVPVAKLEGFRALNFFLTQNICWHQKTFDPFFFIYI